MGPRTDRDIRKSLEGQIDTERWTNLDRQIVRDADEYGVIDMAPRSDLQPDEFQVLKVARLRKLEAFGLAHEVGPGQWAISESAETTLRELGFRGDIIKRMRRSLTERGIERSAAVYDLAGEQLGDPVIGRLLGRGLLDELQGSAFAVIDGVDGRVHHVGLPDLDASGDSEPGSIVELRKFEDARGRSRLMLAIRSDFDIERQVTANGATWLDRQAVSRTPPALADAGFGAEVKDAMNRRAEHLIGQGLAERRVHGIVFARNLLGALRDRELAAAGASFEADLTRLRT